MLKTFFVTIGVSFQKLFMDDVKNDEKMMKLFNNFIYKWDIFQGLRGQYEGGQQRNHKSSSIKSRIAKIDESVLEIKQLVCEISEISCQIAEFNGSTFQLSQSYSKKSNALSNLLSSLGVLKNLVSKNTMLNDLRHRIKQQNDILNSPFMRNNDKLLNFFCENNTELLWSRCR